MPRNRPVPSIPAASAAIPLAVLLALDPDESAEPGTAIAQSPALLEVEAAVFPADENAPEFTAFAAETAFDCEAAGDDAGWPAGQD